MRKDGETYIYNEKQQLIKVDLSGYMYFDFVYDERGNLIEYKETYTWRNERKEIIKLRYDKHNNIIEAYHDMKYMKNKFGKERGAYQYEYDTYGNWIKKIEFIDGDVSALVIRKIEYFE